MRLDHLAAAILQAIPIYVVLSIAGNLLSTFAPIVIKPGSGMPARHQGTKMLYQVAFMFTLPIPLGLTLVPLGVEALLDRLDWMAWFPAFLVLGLGQAAIALWIYVRTLDWQGLLLYRREQQILGVVTARPE